MYVDRNQLFSKLGLNARIPSYAALFMRTEHVQHTPYDLTKS